MIGTLMLTVAVLATPMRTDTTFSVKPGTRLELNNFAGSIAVHTWAKNAVRVGADHSSRARVEVELSGTTLGIKIVHWRGILATVDYELTVPKWMSLELGGVNTDISVENADGEVNAQSVQGEISVTGGSKLVTANSVEGEVRVSRASGKVECNSVNSDVRIEDSSGQIVASSVNGEIVLKGIDSDDVEASTVSGEVTYQGVIKDGGSYHFSTHNGDISIAVPDRANATVSVATYSGEFASAFPVKLDESRRGKRFNFTLGNGSARIELESFQGEIRLRHPGDPVDKGDFEYRYDYEKSKEHAKSKEKSKEKHLTGDEDDKDQEP
jgi:hypothetical protein